ncbi:MAG: c-type cytochrome, partial [Thermoanaerobaculia bacterium]
MSNASSPARALRPSRWVPLPVGSILLALLLPGAALSQDYAAKGFKLAVPSPRETTPENLAAGETLYSQNCSQCHGDEGDGQGVMAD